jgi:hypothetical protein
MNYLFAFVIGGLLCVIGQLLIDDTKLTPARILVGYVVAGVILGAVGVYPALVELAAPARRSRSAASAICWQRVSGRMWTRTVCSAS